ncbi:MAG: hypothetical protein FK734_09495 [Asgard group archaeon]|nr:hypothetical protein [Asgard group archaeon]
MLIKPFIATEQGELPLKDNRTIKNGEKLRLVIASSSTDSVTNPATLVEVLNPLERQVVTGDLPVIDESKLLFFDVIIPENWIAGNYCADILDSNQKILDRCYFVIAPLTPLQSYLTERSLHPKWRIHYRLKIRNTTTKPIGNFSAYVALPMSITPHQFTKELMTTPEQLTISTDVEGNQWTHFQVKLINPRESMEMGYSGIVECNPLLLSQNLIVESKGNPYESDFLRKYLQPEPHIESDHEKIVAMATKITDGNPIIFAKKAIKLVNQLITYKVQPKEYGAAYAVEKKEGDCTEFSALFVALCRAVGIPARTTAGFALAQKNWERHAAVEFMVSGRWIQADVTGQRNNDISLGYFPNYIMVTRGNWMGGTLAQEVSYKYQIMEQNQKLDVDIDWKIIFDKDNKSVKELSPPPSKVKILEPTIQESSKVKILDLQETPLKINIKQKEKPTNELITVYSNNLSVVGINQKVKSVELKVKLPDIIKHSSKRKQLVELLNNSEDEQRGCIEVRQIDDGITKLLYLKGLKLPSISNQKLKIPFVLDKIGTTNLEIIFTNRIGRTIAKEDGKLSVY